MDDNKTHVCLLSVYSSAVSSRERLPFLFPSTDRKARYVTRSGGREDISVVATLVQFEPDNVRSSVPMERWSGWFCAAGVAASSCKVRQDFTEIFYGVDVDELQTPAG